MTATLPHSPGERAAHLFGGLRPTRKMLLSTPSRWSTCLSGLLLVEQSAPPRRDCMVATSAATVMRGRFSGDPTRDKGV